MGDEPFLRSHCPGGEDCYCDGMEHQYVRERTVTPPRNVTRSSRIRRSSNRSQVVETATFSKSNTHSTTVSSSTSSLEAFSGAALRSSVRGTAARLDPVTEGAAEARRSRRVKGLAAIDPAVKEYLAYSSDEEFEQFIGKPKTDYTYARSVSYNVISPERVTPPNMSRRCLHSAGGSAVTARLGSELYDAASSREVRSYQREIESRITTTTTTVSSSKERAAGRGVTRVTCPASSAALLTTASGADGDTRPRGGLYQISRGLDADSGDEDWLEMENNNVSKSSEYRLSEEHRGRRSVRSVISTLLYPFTYLWLAASGAAGRLLGRRRRPPPAAAPAADTVDYRRWMRGVERPAAAAAAGGRYQLRSRSAQLDASGQRRSALGKAASRVTSAVTTTVTTVTSTVVTVLWYVNPVRLAKAAAAAVSESAVGRRLNPAAAARSASEAADLPRRAALLLHWLSPLTWLDAAGHGLAAAGTAAAAALARLNPAPAVRRSWRRLEVGRRCSSVLHGLSPAAWSRALLGLVSGPAAAVASAAGHLSPVPAARAVAVSALSAGRWTGAAAASAGRRLRNAVWPPAGAGSPRAGRYRQALTEAAAGRAGKRRLCLCLLPMLLLLALLLLPLLWGLYCEDDSPAVPEESAVLRELKTAPFTAWAILKDTASFVGTSTVDTASSVYGYLALLGSSAVVTSPAVPPPSPSPAPVFVAPPAGSALDDVHARLAELQTQLAALQTEYKSCRTASQEAGRPEAVRAALGLAAGAGAVLTAEQLSAAERRHSEQLAQLDGRLTQQLAAVRRLLDEREAAAAGQTAEAARLAALEARLDELAVARRQLAGLTEERGRSEQRAAGLAARLQQLQQEFSDLHHTLLVVQESLKQMRSCCNRTDSDWSTLLSQRLLDMEQQLDDRLKVYAATIKQDLTSDSAAAAAAAVVAGGAAGSVSREEVVSIARQTVALYDADKTGKFDYALESAGGSVVSTKCTESYNVKSARISVLGIPLWYPSNNPRTIIQPHVSPGECFAFRGQGYFVIALSRRVVPSGFVMEHISRNLTPSADIQSAPREFAVLGLKDAQDQDGVLLGEYVYEERGPPLQEFAVTAGAAAEPFQVVELRVKSNWGHPDYTCVYRFRVHGVPNQPDER